MILASHQPDFFPYLGYFYKVWKSDVFVFSDNVQFSKSGRHNYNEILTGNGPQRFTLPVSQHTVNLNEIQIAADRKRIDTMLKTLHMEYHNADHFTEVWPFIKWLLESATAFPSLAEFNHFCIMEIARKNGWTENRLFIRSSQLPLTERRDARIIEMCKLLKCDTYYSGSGAKDYHIEADYEAEGIQLAYSDYEPFPYPQQKPKRSRGSGEQRRDFVPNMSIIDYMMNCGVHLPWGCNHE